MLTFGVLSKFQGTISSPGSFSYYFKYSEVRIRFNLPKLVYHLQIIANTNGWLSSRSLDTPSSL